MLSYILTDVLTLYENLNKKGQYTMKQILLALMILMGAFQISAMADTPDPLALPCTVGAQVCVVNKYYPNQKNMYTCYTCADQTCWAIGAAC